MTATATATSAKPAAPPCWRCHGTGVYVWGAILNGRPTRSGPCFACQGGGEFPPNQGRYWRPRRGKPVPASPAPVITSPNGGGA